MKNKISLKDLKVKSFVTELEGDLENTVRGGGTQSCWTCFKCSIVKHQCAPLPEPKRPGPF